MPSTQTSLAAKGKTCAVKAVPIPGYFTLLKELSAAAAGSTSDFQTIQKIVDYLTCKAKAHLQFTEDEMTFLTDLYGFVIDGGRANFLWEAASLLSHYLDNTGDDFVLSADIYKNSVIVGDAMAAIKEYIRHLIQTKKSFAIVRTIDVGFYQSSYAKPLKLSAGREIGRDGYMKDNGALVAEQSNNRLQKANNRFALVATSTLSNTFVHTTWSLRDRYEFQPFSKGDIYTNLPISSGQILKLPDGLSYYLTVLNLAKEFYYTSSWLESWESWSV